MRSPATAGGVVARVEEATCVVSVEFTSMGSGDSHSSPSSQACPCGVTQWKGLLGGGGLYGLGYYAVGTAMRCMLLR